jgi:16S rRNA (guanine527-N7)-methyltransferase
MMTRNNEDFLTQTLQASGYTFSPLVCQQLTQYLLLMQRWNAVFNLTAIDDFADMVHLHILDSLVISPYLQGSRIIDVGTGAGLPGIPLALTQTDKQFVLLDSNSKKTRFLTQVILDLKITNVEVVHARCEDFQPVPKFDSIVSRAFSSIAVMLEKTQHMLATNGQFLAMKGTYPASEIAAMPPDFAMLSAHKLELKDLAVERHLVCIQKK